MVTETHAAPTPSTSQLTAKGVANMALDFCSRHSWSVDGVYRRAWRKRLPVGVAAEALELLRKKQAEGLPSIEHLLPECTMRELRLTYARAVALLEGGAS